MVAPKQKKKKAKFPPSNIPKEADKKKSVVPDELLVMPRKNAMAKVEVVTQKEAVGYEWLRRLAEIVYVTSEQGLTIADISRDSQFKGHVTYDTLVGWCNKDSWVAKRRKYFGDLKNQIERTIGTALVREKAKQLQELQKMKDAVEQKLGDKDVKVGTYEGGVTSYVKIQQAIAALQSEISKEVVPENLGGQHVALTDGSPVTPDLSEHEAREAAMAVLKLRKRKSMEKLQDGKALDKEGDPGTS